ncbi:2'-5' RNA ligase family protein [Asaia spathodeae]|uniref:2'-5' RNA ligase family protein n=1 Tax=Asaia spathodeae TaxID=657016 RepID=UPI002FC3189A
MQETSEAPLIMTLELAPEEQAWAQTQRDLYFPRERNIVPAHVTLFHALPAEYLTQVLTLMRQPRPAPLVQIGAPNLLGKGVAYRLSIPEGAAIRASFCALIPKDRMTRQDQAPWRPHLTVQNKVSPEQARDLHHRLLAEPMRETHPAAALTLWRYLRGPWEQIERAAFTPGRDHSA